MQSREFRSPPLVRRAKGWEGQFSIFDITLSGLAALLAIISQFDFASETAPGAREFAFYDPGGAGVRSRSAKMRGNGPESKIMERKLQKWKPLLWVTS